MKPKHKVFKNGATVAMEKLFPSGMYLIEVRTPRGDILSEERALSH